MVRNFFVRNLGEVMKRKRDEKTTLREMYFTLNLRNEPHYH